MNIYVTSVVEECTKGSDDNTMTFPQVLGKLAEAGVEGYYADLRRATKTFYLPDGQTIGVAADELDIPINEAFDPTGVEAAVQEIQSGAMTYKDFCEKVMAAGCAGYIVSLLGRRVVYFGRTAETHVEQFPSGN